MKVYVAASSGQKAREAVALLTVNGHSAVSKWHESEKPKRGDAEGWKARMKSNLADMRTADVVLAIPRKNAWGVMVEVGHALGCGVPVVVLGLILYTPHMWNDGLKWVKTVDELEAELKRMTEVKPPEPKKKRSPKISKSQPCGDHCAEG